MDVGAGLLFLPAGLLLLTGLAFPLIELLVYGLRIADLGIVRSDVVTFQNYRLIFTDPFFFRILVKTMGLTSVVTLLSLVLGFVIALAILGLRPAPKRLAIVVFLAPLLVSSVAISFGWSVLLGNNGLINHLLRALGFSPVKLLYTDTAIVIGLVHILLPFAILPILAALERLDTNAVAAAVTLGASPWRLVVNVLVPLSLPGAVSGAILVFSLSASAYVTPALLGGGGPNFITTLIFDQFFTQFNWPLGAAMASLLLINLAFILLAILWIGGRLCRWRDA
jgi:putative spermidine/putrescine transport system permease protein